MLLANELRKSLEALARHNDTDLLKGCRVCELEMQLSHTQKFSEEETKAEGSYSRIGPTFSASGLG